MEPGPGAFPPGLPTRQHLPHTCLYPSSSHPQPSGPLQVPGRAASSLAPVLAPVLQPGSSSLGPCPDHPAPGPGRAQWGWRAVLPGWPAVVWLHPRGCGLGTASCLLREAAGISRTNRETTGPCPTRGEGSCLWPRPPTPRSLGATSGEGAEWLWSHVDRKSCNACCSRRAPQEGGLTELGGGVWLLSFRLRQHPGSKQIWVQIRPLPQPS